LDLLVLFFFGLSRNMAGKSKGGKNKGKAPGASQVVTAEPDVPMADVAEVAKAENGEVTEPPAGEADATEKGDGDAPAAALPAKKPAEGESTACLAPQ
jgi:protein TIF31